MKAFIFPIFLLAGTVRADPVEIRLSGSYSIASKLTEQKISEINKACSVKMDVAKTGSGKGLKLLSDKKVDVAMIAGNMEVVRAECEKELACKFGDGELIYSKFSETEYVPIVHPANAMTSLSWAQIKKIYTGAIKNWSEIGPYSAPILAARGHVSEANMVEVRIQIMDGMDFGTDVRELNLSSQIPMVVAQAPGGFGIVAMSHLGAYASKVKILAMEKRLKANQGFAYRAERAKEIACITHELVKK